VHQSELTPFETAQKILRPAVSPLEILGVVFIVAIFALLQREVLRNRLIRLFGSRDLHRTTVGMDDAASRLSRYFLTQLTINACFGIIIAIGLFFIGVPSPILWGVLGTLLRFVPYFGSILSAAGPLALAAAVEPGWLLLFWTLGLYLVVDLAISQGIEPFVYGRSTGLSPISVVISAMFWTWLWGPIGLVLSTPLTMCLLVLGRHVKRLEFLDVMLEINLH
jgi:predicted PurR-regulated permease PerM